MVHIALVGAGLMGTSHLKSLQGNALVTVTGICDVNLEAAQRLADMTGARAYTDLDEMLAKETIDAVIVATPDNLHADPVIRCAKAKKHILCEKPFATTIEDGRAMLAAIEENGVMCQMAHLFRFLPFYRNVANAVEKGQIGEVLSANLMMQNKITVPTKMLRWADRSSPSWFLLAHSIDMLLWVNNSKAVSVRATGVKRKLVNMGINTYDLIKAEMNLDIMRERILFFRGVRDGVATVNTTRLTAVDSTSADSMTNAEHILRQQVHQVAELLRRYVPGFENAQLLACAPVVGIREGRRLNGAYCLTGDDLRAGRRFEDDIAVYAYPIDQHHPDGPGFTECRVPAFGIPYRVLVPKDVENLLVAGRCVSSDREAQSSIRSTPGVMAMGQAAGVAAVQIAAGVAALNVDTDLVRKQLLAQGAYL